MKFLCDQCKAKYQIADDKVAGKTVRMKCRKCGHMIEVRAAVTETSVSIDMPTDEITGSPAPPAGAPKPPKPAPRTGGGLATSLSSAARPAAPRPMGGSRPDGAGGLAGAFTRSVQKQEDDALEMLELHAADEWYVAINGVPVGPVRVAELRRKAAAGAVTEDSLVWQEGLEEWRPVKTIGELAQVVREAIAGGRVSLATPPPERVSAAPPPPARPGAPRPPTASGGFAPPRPPSAPMTPAPPAVAPHAPPMPAAARSNVVPFTLSPQTGAPAAARGGAGLATAERIEERPSQVPSPLGPPPAPTPPPPAAALSIAPDPFAPPPAPAAAATPAPAPAVPISAPLGAPALAPPSAAPGSAAARRSPPWIAIAMIALAIAFGVTAAVIVFTRAPTQQPVVINMPSAQAPAPPPPAEDKDVPPPDTSAAAPSDSASPGKPQAMRAPTGSKSQAAAAPDKPTNPAISALLGGSNGPSLGGPSPGGGGGGGGGQLTSDQIEATVRNHQAGVKRSCFEKIDSKAGTVQITVSAVVGPTGGVQSSNATGNDPMVAKCIENSVRSWQFPASGGTTTVNIPFKFVRQ